MAEEKGLLDISGKTVWGVAALAVVGVGAYLFWRNYNKKKAAELASPAPPVVISAEVPSTKKAKTVQKVKQPRVAKAKAVQQRPYGGMPKGDASSVPT